jgi:glycosyltransferase involved in cell wall biosynthesis
MPVFNGERYLGAAIDSILNQTYSNFELIISDNASTDGTQQICREYAARDGRIRYYRNKENLGLARNFNSVFELSSGEYFKWASSDDLCAPEYVERCVEVLDHLPAIILCFAETIIIDERGTHVRNYDEKCNPDSARPYERFRNIISNLALSNPLFGVIRADTLRTTNLIGKYVASDITLLAELALRGKFYKVSDRLFFRRDHPKRADRANPTTKQAAILYDPDNRGKIHLREWRLFFEYLSSIANVKMSLYEKACCYTYMGKWFRWNWKTMGNELIVACKHILDRSEESSVKPSS